MEEFLRRNQLERGQREPNHDIDDEHTINQTNNATCRKSGMRQQLELYFCQQGYHALTRGRRQQLESGQESEPRIPLRAVKVREQGQKFTEIRDDILGLALMMKLSSDTLRQYWSGTVPTSPDDRGES